MAAARSRQGNEEAPREVAYRLLADVREPLALRRQAFDILRALGNVEDAALLTSVNRRLPFVKSE